MPHPPSAPLTDPPMRCDLCLHRLCLFKTRSQAAKACDEGRVWVNDQPARSSKLLHPGDRVRFQDRLRRREEEIEIVSVPAGMVSRAAARELYRLLAQRELEDPWAPPPRSAP